MKQAETLRHWEGRDAARTAWAWLAALPLVAAQGWRADGARRALFVAPLMGVGIGIYFALPDEPQIWSALVGPLSASVWLFVRRLGMAQGLVALTGALAAAAAGFSLAVVRAQTNDVPVLAHETRLLSITGRIADVEPADKGRTRVLLDVEETRPQLRTRIGRIRVSVRRGAVPLSPGDWIMVRATLWPLPTPVSPGSYDFGRKLWFDGIGAVGFSLAPVTKLDRARADTIFESFDSAVQIVRHAVSERIMGAMSPRAGPIAAAFLTGERGLISDEDNQAMRDSSLAHLLSISGLHMALAGFGFFAALRLAFALVPAIVLNFPVKKWAAGAALIASLAYLLLSGASVPTQRSFVMIGVALIAIMFDRSALNMRVLAVAAIAILVTTPEAWIDPSFQMSFAAVAALIAALEWWSARRIPDADPPGLIRRAIDLVLAAAATSFVAGLATAPFAAFHFNRFADYGVAANVIVTPIVSFVIMPAGVLALVLMPIGLEWLPLWAMEKGIDAMLVVAHWVSAWPGATQAVAAWPIGALALMVVGGLWLAIWLAPWRWFGILPVCAGLVFPFFAAPPDVLIAGDGDNVAVRGADGALHLLSSRRGRFDAQIWLRRDGDSREVSSVAKQDDGGFVCDAAGCLAAIRGRQDRSILVALSPEALAEDCVSAAIVVDLARGWRRPCAGTQLLVTRRLLGEHGAIEARLQGHHVTWTSVARERGHRPWTQSTQ